ncbi:hypothetical protein IMCC20628_02836 [Hoeflea sp. IMCC20628]|uniref:hypothetical protein n=1 Tax=Hoeflea sp. IMCC20628 TaxID=1620421 RepID=UPI00063AEEF9|nr:hypothetical protein [Hoeflea sp. IMCC20628]AKI01531.1 hypothetical protein IMCC20628_02836 [Hoeflea sp. IMCC20628]
MTAETAALVTDALLHSVRNGLMDKESLFALEPDRLFWSGKSGTDSVAYADIISVRLTSYSISARGSEGTHYQAKVSRRGGRSIKIRSHHYVSLGNYENRSDSYAPFIRELCRRIASHAPKARFFSGSTALWVFWIVAALLFVLGAVFLAAMVYMGATAVVITHPLAMHHNV